MGRGDVPPQAPGAAIANLLRVLDGDEKVAALCNEVRQKKQWQSL